MSKHMPSDELTTPAIATTNDPSALKWLNDLIQSPEAALDNLLMGGTWMGGYSGLEAPQALPQFLPFSHEAVLDGALLAWLVNHFQQEAIPLGATAKQYAGALAQSFGLLQVLPLSRCHAWCRERAPVLWLWLNRQPIFASLDHRGSFLRAMGMGQTNQDLRPFWIDLCKQPRWSALAIRGLRDMPCVPGLPIHDDVACVLKNGGR